MKDELGGQIMEKFVGLRAKMYSYEVDEVERIVDEDKRPKGTKRCVIKRKFKFKVYENCLEAAQVENKINHLEKNKIEIDSLNEDQKNNKLILKIQQRLRGDKYNVFTEEINKTALSSNVDKRIQSIYLAETYAHRTSKDLVYKKKRN